AGPDHLVVNNRKPAEACCGVDVFLDPLRLDHGLGGKKCKCQNNYCFHFNERSLFSARFRTASLISKRIASTTSRLSELLAIFFRIPTAVSLEPATSIRISSGADGLLQKLKAARAAISFPRPSFKYGLSLSAICFIVSRGVFALQPIPDAMFWEFQVSNLAGSAIRSIADVTDAFATTARRTKSYSDVA